MLCANEAWVEMLNPAGCRPLFPAVGDASVDIAERDQNPNRIHSRVAPLLGRLFNLQNDDFNAALRGRAAARDEACSQLCRRLGAFPPSSG